MALGKGGADHHEHEHSEKAGKRHRARRICARFWWLFLLILAVVILIIVLPLVYVGYPKLARKAVDSSSLNVTSMSIENPKPDSVQLSFTQIFHTDSSYHPTLYPFNASFYLVDKADNPPFASIRTPEIKAENGTESQIEPQTVNITYPDEFTRYVLLALASEEFTVALRGDGELKQGILPKTSVHYDKNITMKGFDGLKGFSLTSFHLLNETQSDGTNALGTATIPNPTVMTIDLGRVTLAMSVNGTAVGTSTIESLVLKPGDNTIQMRAEVYELVVVGIVISTQNVILPVDIKGNTSTFDGQQIPYFTTMLGATSLRVNLNVTEATGGSGLVDKRALAKFRRED